MIKIVVSFDGLMSHSYIVEVNDADAFGHYMKELSDDNMMLDLANILIGIGKSWPYWANTRRNHVTSDSEKINWLRAKLNAYDDSDIYDILRCENINVEY